MSRDHILAGIRTALGAAAGDSERTGAAAMRLAAPPGFILPARAQATGYARLTQFEEFLSAQGTDLVVAPEASAAPAAIAAYLAGHTLPPRLRKGSDRSLAALPWDHVPELDVADGPAAPDERAGLSRAIAGIAETGTLLLASGPDNPVTLAFVPDVHIVVLERVAIVGSYEEAYALAANEPGGLARTLNFITGASRTSDIGGKVVKGAHGPRRLAVVLVGRE